MTLDTATFIAVVAAIGGVVSALAAFQQARNARIEADAAKQSVANSLSVQQIETFYKIVLAVQAENKRLRERLVELEAELKMVRARLAELERENRELKKQRNSRC